jgi:protein involved in temperature-dependent protein secretion
MGVGAAEDAAGGAEEAVVLDIAQSDSRSGAVLEGP